MVNDYQWWYVYIYISGEWLKKSGERCYKPRTMSSFPLTNSYFFRWLKPATSYNLLCHSVSTQALWWLMTWVVPRFTFSDLYYHTLPGILSGILCDIYNDIYIYLVTLSVIQSDRDCYCWFSTQLVIHSDILSDISFDMLSDKKLDLTFYPDFYLSFYLAFYLAFYLEFDLALYLAFCLTEICIYIYMYMYLPIARAPRATRLAGDVQ